jgi:hypothetical protein
VEQNGTRKEIRIRGSGEGKKGGSSQMVYGAWRRKTEAINGWKGSEHERSRKRKDDENERGAKEAREAGGLEEERRSRERTEETGGGGREGLKGEKWREGDRGVRDGTS